MQNTHSSDAMLHTSKVPDSQPHKHTINWFLLTSKNYGKNFQHHLYFIGMPVPFFQYFRCWFSCLESLQDCVLLGRMWRTCNIYRPPTTNDSPRMCHFMYNHPRNLYGCMHPASACTILTLIKDKLKYINTDQKRHVYWSQFQNLINWIAAYFKHLYKNHKVLKYLHSRKANFVFVSQTPK